MTVPHVSAVRVHVARALRGRGARAKRRAVRWRVDARQGRLGGEVNVMPLLQRLWTGGRELGEQ